VSLRGDKNSGQEYNRRRTERERRAKKEEKGGVDDIWG